MTLKHHLLMTAAALAIPTYAAFAAEAPVVILFSGSGNGILRSCYCPNAPWGGLAKRAWLIRQLRQAVGRENVALLDSGDLFPPEDEPGRSLCILGLYRIMRYDAVAIGDQELAWFKSTAAAPGRGPGDFPWLSASYLTAISSNATPTAPFATPSKILTLGSRRIGIISVTGEDAYRFVTNRLDGLSLVDPVQSIRQFVDSTSNKTDLILVLSHQGLDADRRMAAHLSGVDIIIGGHSQSLLNPPEVVNGIPIFQAGKNGENLGILMITRKGNAPTPPPLTLDHQPSTIPHPDPFAVARTETAGWIISSSLVPLDTRVDEHPAAAELVDRYSAGEDRKLAEWLANPPPPESGTPRLQVTNAIQQTVLKWGERRQFKVTLANLGDTPLVISKIRGKIRWLTVLDFPTNIPPHACGEAVVEITATNIDRFFRSEYTITSSDPKRIVVRGFINGRVEGPMPDIVDVPSLLASMKQPSPPAPSASPSKEANPAETIPPPALSTNHQPSTTPAAWQAINPPPPARLPILVEFFYAAGCADCDEMEKQILPELRRRYGSGIDLREYDIHVRTNYVRLARLQEKMGVRTSETVSLYLNESIHLGGIRAIRAHLFEQLVNLAEREGQTATEQATTAPAPPGPRQELAPSGTPETGDILARRLSAFTAGAVIMAGLVDGINPCAFATIVFFITLLSVTGVRARRLLLVGFAFTLATFTTYLALGFGVFSVLKSLTAYRLVAVFLRWAMALVLGVLAALSFRDAWRFHRTRQAAAVTLQLPHSLKKRIHQIMREGLSSGRLFLGSLVIGILVTLLESVCTGQVYFPTLVYLTEHPALRIRAWKFLFLYNLMFVVPLLLVLMAAFYGTQNQRLLKWSAGNVIWSKSAMGIFFLALLALTLAL